MTVFFEYTIAFLVTTSPNASPFNGEGTLVLAGGKHGVESRDIMAQTGRKSETVMRGYGTPEVRRSETGLGMPRGATAAVKAVFREE
jgi:hypothetical protein